MKKLNLHFKFILLISVFLISSKYIYSQWTIAGDLTGLPPRPTVSVVDGNTAFVTGGDTINKTYKTTNGGVNWIQLNTGTFNLFWSIWAKDANTVFAGAIGNGNQDTIKLYKTTNGGNNWTVVESNFAEIATFSGIKFSNSDPSFGIGVGGAPGEDFYIYKTRDGGNTWTGTQVTGFPGYNNSATNSLNVVDSLFYAFGTAFTSPSIIITTDGGVTWNLRDLNNPSPGFLFTGGIAFKEDKLTGIAGAALPIISRTTNGGLNWVNIDVGNNVTSANCRMRWIEGTNTCYINATDANNGGILKSIDGGLTWTQMTTSGLGIYNFDTRRIGSNVYGYAISSAGGLVGGSQVLKVIDAVEEINPPTNLETISVDSSFIKVSWEDNLNDDDGSYTFYIERTQINDPSHWEVINTVSQYVNQYSDYFVTRGVKYYYRVNVYSGTVYSEYSNIDSAILGGNPSLIPAPPSNLVLFKRTAIAIQMDWQDNSGNENGFIIFRKSEQDLFFEISDSVSRDVVTYQEVGLTPDLDYTYKICSYNASGISDFSNTLIVPGNSAPDINSPKLSGNNILSGNYPNPFNPVTVIRYSLIENRFITLKVYDILGNEVATLVNERQNAGSYEVDFDGSNFSSGVYFYKLQAGEFIETKRMILIK